MKKLIAVTLILAMLLPAAAWANTQEELVGTWVGSSEFDYGKVTYFLLRLYDDHTALYETNTIQMREMDGDCLVFDATWELKDDGLHVRHKNLWGDQEQEEVYLLTQAHYLAYKLAATAIMFVKLPDRRDLGTFHAIPNWD